MHDLAATLKARGITIVISDLFDDGEALQRALKRLRFGGSDVIVFHVLDPSELRVLFDGAVKFKGLEGTPTLETAPASFRKSYLESFHAFCQRVRGSCDRTGAHYVLCSTAVPLSATLGEYLAFRQNHRTRQPRTRRMEDEDTPHLRRPRYRGRNPRGFHEKYKEHDPARFPETVQKVLASGKTPAGSHRPILLAEILDVLAPRPGEFAVDCTLGYGGHARALLERIAPGGHLLALDADPLEGQRTLDRLRAAGFGPEVFTWERRNFAGLAALLAGRRPEGADMILADLGVSSMQLDRPERGFSVKHDGALDMRMNPERGLTASEWLARVRPDALARALEENADEPRAERLAAALAGKTFATTRALADAVGSLVPAPDAEDTVRRVFQAVRIEVNEEFGALDALLRGLPGCLAPGGRAAVLTFHSGEDRRVKLAFREGLRAGMYAAVAEEVIRAGPAERRDNPRSTAAKLRWAIRG